jgi:pyrophosphatase PpaX
LIRCIIFDFDGTIVGGISVWTNALRRTLLRFGVKATRKELEEEIRSSFVDRVIGSPWQKLFNHRIPGKEEEAWSLLQEIMEGEMDNEKVSTDLRRFLERLRSKDIKTGIVTFRRRESVERILTRLNLFHLFDVIIGHGDTSEEKPSPDPFLLASERMNVRPEECLVVGDEPADIVGGRRAGMRTVGVLTGVSDRNMLSKAGVGLIVESLEDLPEALSEMRGEGQ